MTNDDMTGLPQTAPSKAEDGKPYTTLGYMNGPGAASGLRADLTGVDTAAPDFQQQALVPLRSETHGGEDVAIYARGPHVFLFQGPWSRTQSTGSWRGPWESTEASSSAPAPLPSSPLPADRQFRACLRPLAQLQKEAQQLVDDILAPHVIGRE